MSLSPLLLLLVVVCSAEPVFFWGTVMTYYPKNTNADGSVEVVLRSKMDFAFCADLSWECLSGNCGSEGAAWNSMDAENAEPWFQTEGISTRLLPSNAPFQLWLDIEKWKDRKDNNIMGQRAVALVELRNRSDTDKANTSPQTTILPIRVPSNCQRDFSLLSFDPDGDDVKCRFEDTALSECNTCTPQSVLSLSSPCTLSFSPTSSSNEGPYTVQLVMEDFPRQTITLTETNGAQMTITTNNAISKIPVQFVLTVDPVVPSCTEGLYLPRFLSPTPTNQAQFYTLVNQSLEINVKAEANISTISDLLLSGPYNINLTPLVPGQYILSWTPSQSEDGESHSICFVVQAISNSLKYHSDLRCVVVTVGNDPTMTASSTTATQTATPSTSPILTPPTATSSQATTTTLTATTLLTTTTPTETTPPAIFTTTPLSTPATSTAPPTVTSLPTTIIATPTETTTSPTFTSSSPTTTPLTSVTFATPTAITTPATITASTTSTPLTTTTITTTDETTTSPTSTITTPAVTVNLTSPNEITSATSTPPSTTSTPLTTTTITTPNETTMAATSTTPITTHFTPALSSSTPLITSSTSTMTSTSTPLTTTIITTPTETTTVAASTVTTSLATIPIHTHSTITTTPTNTQIIKTIVASTTMQHSPASTSTTTSSTTIVPLLTITKTTTLVGNTTSTTMQNKITIPSNIMPVSSTSTPEIATIDKIPTDTTQNTTVPSTATLTTKSSPSPVIVPEDKTPLPKSITKASNQVVVGLRMKISSSPQSVDYIRNTLIQQLKDELFKRGLPSNITLRLVSNGRVELQPQQSLVVDDEKVHRADQVSSGRGYLGL